MIKNHPYRTLADVRRIRRDSLRHGSILSGVGGSGNPGAVQRRILNSSCPAPYKGHNAPEPYRFKVFIQGQERRVTEAIKRQLRRRSAVEPVIGHLKNDHRMTRNHLAGSQGDAANAVLAAAGHNLRLLAAWLWCFLLALIASLWSGTDRSIHWQAVTV